MTQAKHTPGPWKVAANNAVKAGNKNICSHVNAASREVVNMLEDLQIAKANARLIAAAPDLLEALEALEEAASYAGIEDIAERFYVADALNKARAAIAKATGSNQ